MKKDNKGFSPLNKKHTTIPNFNGDQFTERLLKASGHKYQKEVAADLGIPEGTLSRKSNGNGLIINDLIAISDKYDCSIDYLLGRKEQKQIDMLSDKPLKYSDFARMISRFFEVGLFKKDDNLNFDNVVAQYIYNILRSQYFNDSLPEDIAGNIYKLLLDGICNEFDYPIISPERVHVYDDALKTVNGTFPDFDTWKFIRQPIPELSEQELLKAYAVELAYYGSLPFKFTMQDIADNNTKPQKDLTGDKK